MEKLYTAQEVAEYFKVKVTTVWLWFRKGKLNYVMIGGKKMVKESQLQEFVNGGEKNGQHVV